VPVRGENGLHILRPRIDGLIPGQAGLLTERRHRLDQLIDLRIREMLPVAGLNIFDLIRSRARVPVGNGTLNTSKLHKLDAHGRLPLR
jgi:hypothetical protein